MSLDDTAFPGAGLDGLTYSTFTKPEDAPYGVAHPDNTRLDGVWRRTAVLPTVFPAHMYSLSPDYLWYLSLRPRGVDQVDVRIGVAVRRRCCGPPMTGPPSWRRCRASSTRERRGPRHRRARLPGQPGAPWRGAGR
ncbi:MAG: hypothetical protein WDM92_07970 [Caulobacteraceae bacterium]